MKTNYLAVVVAAIAFFVLGGLWYGVLFHKHWMDLQARGVSHVVPYLVSFLLELLVAYALAQLCIWRHADSASRGASIGVLVWIGFVGPLALMNYMFEMRPKALFAINEFYPLAGLILMGAILGAWKKKTA
jgi:hypothetical protein